MKFNIGDTVVATKDQSDDRVNLCKRGERLVITEVSPLESHFFYRVLWEWLYIENPKAYGFLIKCDEVVSPEINGA